MNNQTTPTITSMPRRLKLPKQGSQLCFGEQEFTVSSKPKVEPGVFPSVSFQLTKAEPLPAATGKTLISFGKHKGTALRDLPADYLLWFYFSTGWQSNNPQGKQVKEYAKANLHRLVNEHKSFLSDWTASILKGGQD